MSVARVTEIIASSKKSFEDADEVGVERAWDTFMNVVADWVMLHMVVFKGAKIAEYRLFLMVRFVREFFVARARAEARARFVLISRKRHRGIVCHRFGLFGGA